MRSDVPPATQPRLFTTRMPLFHRLEQGNITLPYTPSSHAVEKKFPSESKDTKVLPPLPNWLFAALPPARCTCSLLLLFILILCIYL